MIEIYQPQEDSYLLSHVLKKELKNKSKNKKINKNKDLKVLDIGSGSGIQTQTLISLGIAPENITLTDINSDSIKPLKKNFKKSKIIKSNLFEKINKKEKFDVIVFNPPYLPEDKNEPKDSRISTTGGKKGSEIINKFLKQSITHLKKHGIIFLLTSSLTKQINWQDWRKRVIAKKSLFFEELFVWKVSI